MTKQLAACLALLLLSACALPLATSAPPAGAALLGAQPAVIRGELHYTNDLFLQYASRHAVALIDMYGFVKRDRSWVIPTESLVLEYFKLERSNRYGSYVLKLPVRPDGHFVDVDNNGRQDDGVQVFAVGYWSDPFALHDERSLGWPTELVSTINDPERGDEVTGGKLVVYAADAKQQFPTDFGPDSKLFTADDPMAPLAAGYTVVDLGARPFGLDRSAEVQIALNEQKDLAVKNYSELGYTVAFERLVERAKIEYAFRGVQGKEPKWAAVEKRLGPMVKRAEQMQDPEAFYGAIVELANSFGDGHTSVSGGGDVSDAYFNARYAGGVGMGLTELDDGRFIVSYLLKDGPADKAGIERGARVTSYGSLEVAAALADVVPGNAPFSSDRDRRSQQLRYLTRSPIGATRQVSFVNADGAPRDAELTATDEYDSLYSTSWYADYNSGAPPVEYRTLDSGIGYVRVNTNDDDLDLIWDLFGRALESFEKDDISQIIIDLRVNSGGSPVYLASQLTDKTLTLGQTMYWSEADGAFVADGPPDTVEPVDTPYSFKKIALLVGPGCVSACEIEALGFSKLPGALVVGYDGTGGVEAEVARGQFDLPEDITFQLPTGRYTDAQGAILLEGSGIAPTLRVPRTRENVLSDGDPVLAAAEAALAP